MIVILDFGSQYTQLIARRIREARVYCEIHPFNVSAEILRKLRPQGVILSGGPASVYDDGAPLPSPGVLDLNVPYLGICYGMGVLVLADGGVTARSDHREYGRAELELVDTGARVSIFADLGEKSAGQVWMSHGDRLEKLPAGWDVIARSGNSPYAALRRRDGRRYALQFHPEVVHSVNGRRILENFLFRVCDARGDWTMESFVATWLEDMPYKIARVTCLNCWSG